MSKKTTKFLLGLGTGIGLGILFATLGTLLVGIIDGFMRPLTCNL